MRLRQNLEVKLSLKRTARGSTSSSCQLLYLDFQYQRLNDRHFLESKGQNWRKKKRPVWTSLKPTKEAFLPFAW